jgi:Flp pilus assembly protein TadD
VADAAIAGGDPQMALSVSQSVLATDPGNVDALVHEGDAYYALGRCASAEASYQLALKGDPKSSKAETGMGRCLLKVAPSSAEVAFLAATQDDPGNADALNDLGVARDMQGNFAGAVVPYQQALLADPSLMGAEVNIGLSLALSGQGPEALQYLGPLATGPDATPKIREDYAVALVSTGRNDEARQILTIDLPPGQVDQALAGYQALVSNAIANPPPQPPPPPTVTDVQTTQVTAIPEVPATPPASAAPIPLLPAPASAALPPPAISAPLETSAPASVAPVAAPSDPTMSVQAPAKHRVKKHAASDVSPLAPSAPPPATLPEAAAMPMPLTKPIPAPTQAPATPVSVSPPVTPSATPPAAVSSPSPVVNAAAPSTVPSSAQIAAMPASAPDPEPMMAPPPGNGVSVQLAALDSPEAAHHEWQAVYNKAPALFAGKAPEISKVSVRDKTYYRLRVGGFSSTPDAAKFCAELSATGTACTLANF